MDPVVRVARGRATMDLNLRGGGKQGGYRQRRAVQRWSGAGMGVLVLVLGGVAQIWQILRESGYRSMTDQRDCAQWGWSDLLHHATWRIQRESELCSRTDQRGEHGCASWREKLLEDHLEAVWVRSEGDCWACCSLTAVFFPLGQKGNMRWRAPGKGE